MQKTTVFSGVCPTTLYFESLLTLLQKGKTVSPRGIESKELRPAIFEYHNPAERVTFLKGRVINPFFQLAESLWIIAGRSDVEWLVDYNKNMAQFSDDGVNFNAPYGERLRFWNQNNASSTIPEDSNTLDQLMDVYKKLSKDEHTRQAVASIYNPIFDHADKETLDRPCNLMLVFKIRDGELDLTVYNRSNDLHWGTFGANLCQFSTILELMSSWLGIPMGVYYQVSDSLHIYTQEYGAKETNKILNAYGIKDDSSGKVQLPSFNSGEYEPRITSSVEETKEFIQWYFNNLDIEVSSDITYENNSIKFLLEEVDNNVNDKYFNFIIKSMIVYQAHRRRKEHLVIEVMSHLPACSWSISMLRFLHKHYGESENFVSMYDIFSPEVKSYIAREGE